MSYKNKSYKLSLKEKAKNWGKKKLNPVTQLGNATPWSIFKNEHEQHQQHEDATPSKEEIEFKKQRERNYRKSLIEEGLKQPRIWEKFENEDDTKINRSISANQGWQKLNSTQKKVKNLEIKKGKIEKLSNNKNPFKEAHIITETDLKDFDSRNLTFAQNNHLKKAITKAATAKNFRLHHVVADLKYQNKKWIDKSLLKNS